MHVHELGDVHGPHLGVRDTNGSGPPAGSLYTATGGAFYYTVIAISQDGLSTAKTIHYTVSYVPTKTAIACSPAITLVAQQTTCTVTVTNSGSSSFGAPSGTVALSSTGTGLGAASCALAAAGATGASCQVTDQPGYPGPQTLTASYPAGSTFGASKGHTSFTVKDATSTVAYCAPTAIPAGSATTCVAIVLDTSLGLPTSGTLTFSAPAGDSLNPTSCALTPNFDGEGNSGCQTTFTAGTKLGDAILAAKYSGSTTELTSRGVSTITIN
jgi:hypothetical protein